VPQRIVTFGRFLVTVAVAVTLSGCSQLALNFVAMGAFAKHNPNDFGPGETNRRTYGQTVETVYSALTVSVERDARRIVERDPIGHALKVSYPTSWTLWSGTLTVSCTPDSADDSPVTVVRVIAGETGMHADIRKLGDSILANLDDRLARQ
jgi:hypothetical protein